MLLRESSLDFEMAGTEIKPIEDPKHPCSADKEYSYGLFATQDFPPNTFVGQYAGAVKLHQPDDTSRYLVPFYTDKAGREYDIDAEHFGNEARFINDFRGVPGATGANVQFQACNCATTGYYFIAVMTTQRVRKGTEFLVDYGPRYWASLAGGSAGL
eukprot:SAG31_NODE_557_length_14160_cov_18.420880_10_plen_157_part_00